MFKKKIRLNARDRRQNVHWSPGFPAVRFIYRRRRHRRRRVGRAEKRAPRQTVRTQAGPSKRRPSERPRRRGGLFPVLWTWDRTARVHWPAYRNNEKRKKNTNAVERFSNFAFAV